MSALPVVDTITLNIIGIPQPQGNKTGYVNKRTGKVAMVEGRRPEARAAFKDWRGAVSQAARDWQADRNDALIDDPVAVTMWFWLPRPPSIPKKRVYPAVRPDGEKLARAVMDALTGIIITDDARACEHHIFKRYAVDRPPGATITIEKLA
jgi:crossover junction endodeoxyribonuclease RusA